MPTPTQRAIGRFRELLLGEAGLRQSVTTMRPGIEPFWPTDATHLIGRIHAPAELKERGGYANPSFEIYVERIQNRLEEKFRRFSGAVEIVTEITVSQDRIDGLASELQFYADAVTDVVERHRGSLGEGMTLSGTYEVKFEPVRKGGLNYQQIARVRCEMHLSRN